MKLGEMLDPRKEFGKAVTEEALKNPNIVLFSADSGKSSGFGEFMEACPDRYFESGIMEQAVIGMASGIATTNLIPIFCAIAPFVTCRPFEMFRNDVGYMNQNVKIVGRNSGITYSDLGSTHQSLEDFGIIRMIPGVTVLAPEDPSEIHSAVKAMIEYKGPVYMRIGNPKIPVLFEEKPFVIGKGSYLRRGDDLTIVSTGSMTGPAIRAGGLLEKNGISVDLISMPTVIPLDEEILRESAEKTKNVLTVEEHYENGGLGTIISENLSCLRGICVKRMGIPNCYTITGPYDEILTHYGLTDKGIAQMAMLLLEKSEAAN